jgi:hypothetical protein
LKVAPKGIAKDHPEIDLLKLRSIAVVHQYVLRMLPGALNRTDIRQSTIDSLTRRF